ncbi:MOSC and FAD-binding oxidoreductase domain-containing protein [Mycolicibacterium rufum]|uniref:nitric oxide dioxygenase n=1 Tax=Mycolicibacterium rufum TaxID=318424 RepID=A0A9X2YF58_9MYCO|nr:MOSC and FAD-binding oxidoreductase domain-containing protein [Mycolicibacterium rufum]KGI70444.1 sulfurase [Mycolicibacterium rufum]MCV7072603.1 MOSC domain-containing protein [Mycolicibacterium rufum]ULP36771.1 MOSC and FAD-binding oxidoreductase domain-containing protein [Mycolicibacterium rufum]
MATLVSVNVGLPEDIAWNGRTVHTGAWKHPVTGPRRVRRLNIDGDGQGDLGGHGGENRAVLVYQLDSYRHWAREFGRDDLEPGLLGENLTVEGLPDDEVCIGDRYRVGEVVLEVTQPRVTCYRAGMRIGEPRMAALLVAHRRPGFYCRVITEGDLEAGLDIVKIADGPEGVTVAEIDALLYLPGHPRDTLERALRIPALSPGWQMSLQALADEDGTTTGNAGLAVTGPPPAWTGFRALSVREVHDESRSVRSVLLADPSGVPLPDWIAGQAITLRIPGADGSAALVRSYSLSNAPGGGRYRISVKREPHGAASGYLHSRLRPGDVLDVAAPRGTFRLGDDASPVVLVSAGVGVTPVLSMLYALVAAGTDRPVWWLHGARDGAEHPFAAEARELLKRLPHSRFHVMYSQPAESDRPGVDYDERGRLAGVALDALDVPRDASAYVCGPAVFMTEMEAALIAHGLDASRVHTELFGAGPALTPGIAAHAVPPHQPAGAPGPGPDVQFARSGLSAPWGPPATTLLEFAEACDVPTRWSCRTGVCHNCETALLAGAVRYAPEPLEPPAEGNVLICCAQPTEAVVLDL